MKAVIQRVKSANVKIDGIIHGEIAAGLLVLLATAPEDDEETMKWFANKIVNLRVFPDEEGKMNRSALDLGYGILMISNFTVYGDVRKGFRPSFSRAAAPDLSEPLYYKMVDFMRKNYPLKIESGVFGAMMDVELVNDGPVTIIIEKEKK